VFDGTGWIGAQAAVVAVEQLARFGFAHQVVSEPTLDVQRAAIRVKVAAARVGTRGGSLRTSSVWLAARFCRDGLRLYATEGALFKRSVTRAVLLAVLRQLRCDRARSSLMRAAILYAWGFVMHTIRQAVLYGISSLAEAVERKNLRIVVLGRRAPSRRRCSSCNSTDG
jgi:hypothetical protein